MEGDGKFRFEAPESLRILPHLATPGEPLRPRTAFQSLTSRNEDLAPVATVFGVISGKDGGTKEGRLRRFPLIEAVARA